MMSRISAHPHEYLSLWDCLNLKKGDFLQNYLLHFVLFVVLRLVLFYDYIVHSLSYNSVL